MTSNEPSAGTPQGNSNSSPGAAPAAINAAESDQYQAVRDLAMQLNPTTSATKSCSLSKAIVQSVQNVSGQVTVTIGLSGDTTPIAGVRIYDWYSPVVGDTVDVLLQDNDIVVIGRKNVPSTTTAANGWVTPALGSGFSSGGNTPQYRIVNDNGDRKIQLRGTISVSGSPTALWTMPADARPAAFRLVLAGRDVTGGSNVVQIGISSSGPMTLEGRSTGIKDVSNPSSTGSGGTGLTGNAQINFSHTHKFLNLDFGNVDAYRNADANVKDVGPNQTAHSHSGPSHSHSIADPTLTGVSTPTIVYLDGIEYFL